ncbi:MAG: monovalent cation/H(+) antiporter subunit G [Alkalibacterium sp.]|uniref:Multisubunit sodium/proton antiporter, MrpG subunit n=1 Tax=Alkalibacterium gilvum TaxID=1130080 RepID=A0A1H6SMD8_9LACT|nr:MULTISPECIES: monovalent cation/H(+) antiporter subunit G [Alkalibacterium]MDN6293939.1 monovalent cation/H(+) antiporter subunit G [Alkalibacterium sp.]MDN6295563.1 monovalent cation/H(+) antiporter subunit G [Alkalibacterium sp.]MDN6327190.1 monovalent cation/H(+) antiporter subunit G [Alkalibacterium sp.]MDN6385866.1 monovalent cation/H(+) antiporter subunit G [Alkalibacterium sp.]MDN6398692.1 monovalent cation/H(+) antiporter subunit G [Alkalibacterium sp.]
MNLWTTIIGNIIIVIGLIFMTLGVLGIYRFNDYFSRILITSKVDTVGFLTIMTGMIIKHGFAFFSGKIVLILALYMITNPIATHAITRAAHISGYRIKKER